MPIPNYSIDAFVKSAIDDVPQQDYGSQIHELVEKLSFAHLPDDVHRAARFYRVGRGLESLTSLHSLTRK